MSKLLKRSYKQLIRITLFIVIYRLTLDYIYVNVISPIWSYQHFYTNVNNSFLFISYIWLFFIILFDRKLYEDKRPSSIFLLLLDFLFFIPLSSVIPLSGMSLDFLVYCLIYWSLVALFQYYYLRKKPPYSPKNAIEKRSSNYYFIIASIIIGLNFLITLYFFGFHIKLDLEDVYDIRYAVRDLHLPTAVKYLKPIASKLTLITILVVIIKRKYLWLIPLVLVQLENFAFGALKSDFFALILVFIVGFFYKTKHLQYIFYALIIANVIVLVEFVLTGSSLFSIIIHRRVLFMPSILSNEYFTYFSGHELVYLRDSFLRYFGFHSPYDLEVPMLIGREYYDSPEANCNTGIIGDDFAQLGWFSLLVFPYLRYKILTLYDRVLSPCEEKMIVYVGFIFSLVFISGTFFSSLITGGFLVIILLLYVLTKKIKIKL